MKGTHQITIQNKKIKYSFSVRRNITVIRGNSATGKTVLIEMVREYSESGKDSGITLQCDKPCAVLSGMNWEAQLSTIHDSIVFIDEGSRFVSSKDFAAAIQKTDNYYVIVTREGLSALPYSVNEIYGIRDAGKYGQLKQTYNELYHIYAHYEHDKSVTPTVVITEDSNSGFQFFGHVCSSQQINCISANGKSNIFKLLLERNTEPILVIADGAAFGSEMEKVIKLQNEVRNFTLYLPESFEWLILKSDLIKDKTISNILADPSSYIESKDYFSWERFFTALLTKTTEATYLQYSKHSLNPAYLQDTAVQKILDETNPLFDKE
ncbi:MAG: translation initiation factor 2 [Clostridiales bacterium]|nr:translation initiation factor 2 [Clostridiales bacterium]